jgi:hypothetical protein
MELRSYELGNLQGTNAIMRKMRIESAMRRETAMGILGFSMKVLFGFDLGGGADCVTDSTAIVSTFFNFLPPISILLLFASTKQSTTLVSTLK